MNWSIFGCAVAAVGLMIAYFVVPEKAKELIGDLLIIFGWLILLGFFCFFWVTGKYLCVGEPNLGIRVFETIAITGLVVFGFFRLHGDL